ncbi:serine hydrolase [Fictibacillus gelatini]|uniref:serine hydrolase n=1 Tax=Fictibacillus gelatini TaxID=225985 RepID=UPI000427F90F|nr:serine hydrolase [Fictibacillus gelatini]
MSFYLLKEHLQEVATGICGKMSIVLEIENLQISINGDDPFPSASLIKIPIMMEAFRQAQIGMLDLDETYRVPSEAPVGGMGVIQHLRPEIELSIHDLITLMIIVSDNTATNLLIDLVGMEAVNKLSSDLGCNQTLLARKMMDVTAQKNGKDNWTSAYDIVKFLKEIDQGKLLTSKQRTNALKTLRQQQFHSKLPALISESFSEETYVAHKTGELPGTEHDAGIIQANGKRAYIAVLTTDLDNNITGQKAIAQIGKLVFDHIMEK